MGSPVSGRIGSAFRLLPRGTFDCVRAEGSKAVPVCSYLVAWAKRHPEVHDLLA